jgi:hypothetical protein
VEGCRPIHGKIETAKSMPEQRHSRLSRTGPGDSAAMPKQISQCLKMLRRFRRGNKPMQKDCHHFSVVNEHEIFTQFFEITEIGTCSLVLPFIENCVSEPYHLPHEARDTVPFAAIMPDDPNTLTGTPIFRRMQFNILARNPQDLVRWITIPSEC